MKFAAIDIGTNAVRLLLTRVFEIDGKPLFKKESLVRIPIRLGEDVFATGVISEEKIDDLVHTMIGFRNLIKAYGALDYMACATSAVREADNGPDVVGILREKSGLTLEIIDGRREAEIISFHQPFKFIEKDKSYLFIDVGGGSTELSLIASDHTVASKSFKIGGIRMLQNVVNKEDWDSLKKWLKKETKSYQPLTAIGSGGNINKLFRMARKKDGELISYKKIKYLYDYLRTFTFQERISSLHLRPDRADVIVPASEIYLSVMKWAGIKRMYVPQAGLPDGMVRVLYCNYKDGSETSDYCHPQNPVIAEKK